MIWVHYVAILFQNECHILKSKINSSSFFPILNNAFVLFNIRLFKVCQMSFLNEPQFSKIVWLRSLVYSSDMSLTIYFLITVISWCCFTKIHIIRLDYSVGEWQGNMLLSGVYWISWIIPCRKKSRIHNAPLLHITYSS